MNLLDLLSMNRQKPDPTQGTGHVFNPYGKNSAPQRQQQQSSWMNKPALGGSMSRGDLLLASMGMLSGRNFQEGMGNAAQYMAYGMDRANERQKEQAQKAAMAKAMSGIDMTPQQRALAGANPGGVIGALTEQAFATPQTIEGKAINNRLVNPVTGEVMGDYSDPSAPMSTIGKLRADLDADRITQAQFDQAVAGKPMVQVYTGSGQQVTRLADVPMGQPIPEGLLPADLLEKGQVAVRADNPYGFKVVNAPGSSAAMEAEAARQKEDKNLGGTALTVGSLINSYATLANNKAITAQGNTAAENVAALYSGTGLGQLQDQVGGEVGNLANAEARKNIEGLSMNALMKMISMSDVSAKAMDSDAEMKAWLSAIKSDNYESALTKLYVLDKSFGDGMALQKAYEAGTIDLDTYKYVTNRAQNDTYGQQMVDRLMRYKALGDSVGESNLTPGERQTSADLQGLLASDGTPVTEDDIQTTMAKYGMTREEVIARLRGQ